MRSFLQFGGATVATLNIKNFPDTLYRRIKLRAGSNRRSIAQEVVQILDGAIARESRVSLLELEGLGKAVWKKSLQGKDAAEYIAEERDSWD
jgi:plasmid stability protein